MAQDLIFGAATAAHPHETANGDAWLISRHGDEHRIALIDGVGHGEPAALAASVAVATLEEAAGHAPHEALTLCHARLRDTRGAVIAIAAIDTARSLLTFAGVGNIEARLVQNGREQRLVSHRGLLGASIPTIRTFEHALYPPWILIMHSDGVSGRLALDADDIATAWSHGAQALAERLLDQWGRARDDATVIVAALQHVAAATSEPV